MDCVCQRSRWLRGRKSSQSIIKQFERGNFYWASHGRTSASSYWNIIYDHKIFAISSTVLNYCTMSLILLVERAAENDELDDSLIENSYIETDGGDDIQWRWWTNTALELLFSRCTAEEQLSLVSKFLIDNKNLSIIDCISKNGPGSIFVTLRQPNSQSPFAPEAHYVKLMNTVNLELYMHDMRQSWLKYSNWYLNTLVHRDSNTNRFIR